MSLCSNVIFLDVETTGVDNMSEVLSISMLKVKFNEELKFEVVDSINRYYYSKGFNGAFEINGLDENSIDKLRGDDCKYAEFFYDFWNVNDIKEFCKGINHYVAHNIRFDMQWLGFLRGKNNKYFCTMLSNIDIVKIKNKPFSYGYSKGYKYKRPRLIETIKYYGINIDNLHNSKSDTKAVYKIFLQMNKDFKTKKRIINFLNYNIYIGNYKYFVA